MFYVETVIISLLFYLSFFLLICSPAFLLSCLQLCMKVAISKVIIIIIITAVVSLLLGVAALC